MSVYLKWKDVIRYVACTPAFLSQIVQIRSSAIQDRIKLEISFISKLILIYLNQFQYQPISDDIISYSFSRFMLTMSGFLSVENTPFLQEIAMTSSVRLLPIGKDQIGFLFPICDQKKLDGVAEKCEITDFVVLISRN